MKKKSTWVWIPIIIIILGGSGWFLFGRGSAKDIEYRFDEVRKGDISIVVTATGTLEAVTTVQVGSQVSGTIAKLYADFNTVVKAGDVIAEIDPTFLQAQVKESEANLERATAQSNDNKRIYDRSSELFKKGLISQAEYDAARTTQESQSATVKQTQAALDRARVNLKYATIRAPIDGVVISRNVDIGQTVAASFSAPTIFVIANDLTKMQVQASIDEADIGRINLGQDVSFTVDAYPEERFRGRVSEIRLQPNNVQNVINYTVIIDVPNNDLKLMPGMTANVTVLVDRKTDVLRVPNLALRFVPPDLPESEKRQSIKTDSPPEKPDTSKRKEEPTKTDRKSRFRRDVQSPSTPHASVNESRNPSEGMSREQMMEKFSNTSPGEKQRMREQSMSRSGGQSDMGSGQWRDGKGSDFKAFDRQEMLASKDVSENGKPARMLTDKWRRTVNTYQRKEFSGRIWIMDENKQPTSLNVRLGISDGMFIEVVSGDLKEGQKIIVGSIVKNDVPPPQSNPFSGQQQRPMGGGRSRGF